MRYAILGTGSVGRTLAAKLSALGHEATVGTRDVEATLARTETDRMGNAPFPQWQAEHPAVGLATFAGAARTAQAVVCALNGLGALDALRAAGAANLAGKPLIDVSNPLDASAGFPPRLVPVDTDSLGEQIQREFPDAKVVKTLNTMNAAVMVDPGRAGGASTVFLSGDDADAKKAVAALLGEFGWPQASILDLGGIETARGAEMATGFWVRVYAALGTGDFNFHIQRAR
ncbi:MAG TPA: NAD(P)-binding domain-containing protein [Actinocrinis sp.]|nr:NAD(P)-binding domain-containing protein [Actinocrinis sp.]